MEQVAEEMMPATILGQILIRMEGIRFVRTVLLQSDTPRFSTYEFYWNRLIAHPGRLLYAKMQVRTGRPASIATVTNHLSCVYGVAYAYDAPVVFEVHIFSECSIEVIHSDVVAIRYVFFIRATSLRIFFGFNDDTISGCTDSRAFYQFKIERVNSLV